MNFTKPLVKNRILSWILRCIVWSPVWFLFLPLPLQPVGYLMGALDVYKGHYELKSSGLPAPWLRHYAEMLKNKYGIKLKTTAGCIVIELQLSYDTGYNLAQRRGIIRKYGYDITRECADEAKAEWHRNQASESAKASQTP